MDINESLKVSQLLDSYGSLLTDKQLSIMNDYFNFDLSLSEIAENNNTTRAAVHDIIKRTTKVLEDYEDKLQLVFKKTKIEEIIKDLDEDLKNKIEELL